MVKDTKEKDFKEEKLNDYTEKEGEMTKRKKCPSGTKRSKSGKTCRKNPSVGIIKIRFNVSKKKKK